MPTTLKITKEMILNTAFDIVREKGIDAVSNRLIASRLRSSIRPIYYQFKNVEELNRELNVKIEKYFFDFLFNNIIEDVPPYKQTGINYIRFAQEEKNLFKALFMRKSNFIPEDFVSSDMENYNELKRLIKMSTQFEEKDIKDFHIKMWIFTHGLASLVATETVDLSNTQIRELLSLEFQALMLLKGKNKNK